MKFDEKGLLPAIAQDAETGEVLMLAYMNHEALLVDATGPACHTGNRTCFFRRLEDGLRIVSEDPLQC